MSQFIKQFSERTLNNLDIIEENACNNDNSKERKGFEVTQLINSMFGLVLVPYEAYKDLIRKKVQNMNVISGGIKDKKTENQLCDEWLKEEHTDEFMEIRKVIDICKNDKRIYSGYNWDEDGITITSFMWHLRNSIAHSGTTGVSFFPITGKGLIYNEITHVIFHCGAKGNNEFCIKLELSELKTVITNISKIFNSLENSELGQKMLSKTIESINACEKLMQDGKRNVQTNERHRRSCKRQA